MPMVVQFEVCMFYILQQSHHRQMSQYNSKVLTFSIVFMMMVIIKRVDSSWRWRPKVGLGRLVPTKETKKECKYTHLKKLLLTINIIFHSITRWGRILIAFYISGNLNAFVSFPAILL